MRTFDTELEVIADLRRRVRALEAALGRGLRTGESVNGDWALLPSGLLICRQMLLVTANSTTWTYPLEFGVSPQVVGTALTGTPRFVTLTRGTTTASVNVFDTSGSFPGNTNVLLIAIGVPA